MKGEQRERIENYWRRGAKFVFKPTTVLFIIVSLIISGLIYSYHLTLIPVFADEAIYIRWAQLIKNVPTLKFVPLQDGKQPLFMWVLAFLLKLKLAGPLYSGRFLSLIFGLADVLVTSFLFLHLLNPSFKQEKRMKVAFYLSYLSLVSLPYIFFFSRLSLVDMMLSFWYAVGIFLFLVYWRYPRLDLALISGFVFGLAWLTKSPGLILLVLALFWLLIRFILSRCRQWKILGHSLGLFLTTNITYGVLRLSANYHMINQRNKDYLFSFHKFLTTPFDPLWPHLKDVFNFYWFYFTPLGLVLIVFGFLLFIKNREYKKITYLIFLSFIFLPFIFSLIFAKVFTARYLLYFSIPLVFFIIYLYQNLKSKKLITLFLILFLFWSWFYNYQLLTNPTKSFLPVEEYRGYLTAWTAGWGIKPASNFFKKQAKKKPVVVGCEGYFGTLPDGLWIYLDGLANVKILGGPVPVKNIPSSLIESAKAGNLTYLIGHRSRFQVSSAETKSHLVLIKTYPKPIDPLTHQGDALLIWQVKP